MRPSKPGPEVICPNCGESARYSTANPYRPFCSERCKVIDLGAWANEDYRIAGSPQDVSSDDPEADLN
ncbi:MAG: DNA gyrase inhibitor YacG [Burkholderiaceae bacterium]